MRDYENRQYEEQEKDPRQKEQKSARKKRKRNREYTFVSWFFILIFLSLIGYVIYFNVAVSEDFINSPYNTRQDTFSDRVIRGNI